jgi:hypothetical protein
VLAAQRVATPKRSPPTPLRAAGPTKPSGSASSSLASAPSSPGSKHNEGQHTSPRRTNPPPILLERGEPVAFTVVNAAAGLGQSTLYRDQRLHAAIDEHRTYQAQAHAVVSEIARPAHRTRNRRATVKNTKHG